MAWLDRSDHSILTPMGDTFTLGELCLVDDVSSADWIVAGVRDFEHDVGSLLPVGFDAYARVCHPALRRLDGDAWAEVSWAQVATANGRVADALMEWIAITGEWRYLDHDAQPGIWDRAPRIGGGPERHVGQRYRESHTARPSCAWCHDGNAANASAPQSATRRCRHGPGPTDGDLGGWRPPRRAAVTARR